MGGTEGTDAKQFSDIKKMISVGNKFKFATVMKTESCTYSVSFKLNEKCDFEIHTQMRADRKGGLKLFKSVDSAISEIEKTGFKGLVAYKIE